MINTDRTWDFGGLVAHLTNSVRVDSPGSLTIAPGSIIKLANAGHDLWANTGPIIASGTPEAPIVFTSAKDDSVGGDTNADGTDSVPSPGDWQTLFLYHGDSVLENVEVRYAGGASTAQVVINEQVAGTDGQSVELTSCLLYTSPSPRDATLSRMPSSA